MIDGSVELVADWPLSGVGHYELRLELGNDLVEISRWAVNPGKISPDDFKILLDDLEHRLPVTITLALQKMGAITGTQLVRPTGFSSAAEEIARLRRTITKTAAGPGLALILNEIAQDPHQVLRDVEIWVPAARARRVSATGLVRAVAVESGTISPGVPDRLPDSRVEATVDVYENRLLKAFLEQVELRLRRLRAYLITRDREASIQEIDMLSQRLHGARKQASFLRDVSRLSHAPTDVTMVLVKKPAYRKLLEAVLDFRNKTVVRLNEPKLDSPLENLPSLYETWGVLQALQALLELAANAGFQIKHSELFRRDLAGSWIEVLPNGRPALLLKRPSDKKAISVTPQRIYSTHAEDLHSVSYPQKPDLAIEVSCPNRLPEVYLLDPKYKLDSQQSAAPPGDGKPKKVDIDKMHAYRDAIRNREGNRVVQFAGILYPGSPKLFGPGVAAISAVPSAQPHLADQLRQVLAPVVA